MTISISTKRKAIGFDYDPSEATTDQLFLDGKEDGEWKMKKPITSLEAGEFDASYPKNYKGKTELRVVDAEGNVIDQTPEGGIDVP